MAFYSIPGKEAQDIRQGIEQAEKEGFFDGMFANECRQPEQFPSKEKLLDSIRPGMKLYKSFFLKTYGYEISEAGFKDEVISRLKVIGCWKAAEYYRQVVEDHQKSRKEEKIIVRRERQEEGEEERKKKLERRKRWRQFGNLLNYQ